MCKGNKCKERKSYSGFIAHNDNSKDAMIDKVYVESAGVDWAETFWTIYDGPNCTGKSAIMPIQERRPFTEWKDYIQDQLGFNRHTRWKSFMPAIDPEAGEGEKYSPNLDLWLYSVGGTELQHFETPEGCQNIEESAN